MSQTGTEVKMQYILDGNMELAEIPKDSAVEVECPINYKLKNAFEVFVLRNILHGPVLSQISRIKLSHIVALLEG